MARWIDDPSKVPPMLAALDAPPLTGSGLVYEPKYDGMRVLADIRPGTGRTRDPFVGLYSRNAREKQAQFPAIAKALGALGTKLRRPLLLDGEIVAVDDEGQPLGFQHIQGRLHLQSAGDIREAERIQPAVFVAFDVIRDGDEDLRPLPMAARRMTLQTLIKPGRGANPLIRLSEIAMEDGREMLIRAKAEGWEGLIVKDAHAPYRSGRRTPAWRKLKIVGQQEFVVGGWTEPRETRTHFGALLVGYYEGTALRWAGSVGTGFSQGELERMSKLLREREISSSRFADPVQTQERAHWVRPELVIEVRFTEWTSDALLRHPVYLGLRTDKKASDVTRETTARKSDTPKVQNTTDYSRVRRKPKRAGPAPADLSGLVDQLLALETAKRDGVIALPNGDSLGVTNLAKVFWPDLGITKGELLRYYVQASPFILPAVDDRPLIMKRFPNGIAKSAFYQQRHPESPPPGVRRAVLPDDVEPIDEEGPRDRLIGGSLTTLLYMTQIAAISQDPWFSRVSDPLHMDYAAIDLDPGDGATFGQVLDVARWVKEELDAYGIEGFPKTSGSSGLHIYIRMPPSTTYETGQLLCQVIATLVATKHPKVATIERMVKRRPAKTIYVDYLQNILGKSIATAYSARASDYAGVSTPVTWQEVAGRLNPRDFTIRTALARFVERGDLWEAFRKSKPVNLKAVLAQARRG